MTVDEQPCRTESAETPAEVYHPPTVTVLGTLAELTQQKEVGGADGSTFLGLDIGS
jgi:hypothetical protein